MAGNKTQDQSGLPSPDRVQTAPRPQPGHDVTVQTIMQMQKALREMKADIDGLPNNVEPIGRRLDAIEKSLFLLKIGSAVAVVLIAVAASVFWWATDHRLAALEAGIASQPQSQVTTDAPQQAGSTP